IPAPKADRSLPLRALIFDSWYDQFRGVVVLVRLIDGKVKKGQKVRFYATEQEYELTFIGVRKPFLAEIDELEAGQVGVLAGNFKDIPHARVGDTVIDAAHPTSAPLGGFKTVQPMVFAGLFPVD